MLWAQQEVKALRFLIPEERPQLLYTYIVIYIKKIVCGRCENAPVAALPAPKAGLEGRAVAIPEAREGQ